MNVIYFPNFSRIGRTLPKDTCSTSDRGNVSSLEVINPVKVQYFLKQVVRPTFHSGPTQINLLLPHKPEEMHPLWSKLTNLIGEVSWKF